MTPQEQLGLQRMSRTMRLYIDAAEAFRISVAAAAMPPSPIGRSNVNKHLSWNPDAADMRLRGVVDHAEALMALVNAGLVPRAALYTLMRAMFEAEGVAYWLLGPNQIKELSWRRNLDRGYQMFQRLEALDKKTTVRAAGSARQVRTILPQAAAKTTTYNVLEVAKRKRPGMTSMVTNVVGTGGAQLYHWLSGYAHSENWAVMDGVKPVATAGPTAGLGFIEANVQRILLFWTTFYLAHERVLQRWIILCGAEPSTWGTIRDSIPSQV